MIAPNRNRGTVTREGNFGTNFTEGRPYHNPENLKRLLATLWDGGDVYPSVNGLGRVYITPLKRDPVIGELVLCRCPTGAYLRKIAAMCDGGYLTDAPPAVLDLWYQPIVARELIDGLVLRIDP